MSKTKPGIGKSSLLHETLFHVPKNLESLARTAFTWLPYEEAGAWRERFGLAIEPGADLTQVADRFVFWLLSGEDSPLTQWRKQQWMVKVADLYRRRLDGDEPTDAEWDAAAEWVATKSGSSAAWEVAEATKKAWRQAEAVARATEKARADAAMKEGTALKATVTAEAEKEAVLAATYATKQGDAVASKVAEAAVKAAVATACKTIPISSHIEASEKVTEQRDMVSVAKTMLKVRIWAAWHMMADKLINLIKEERGLKIVVWPPDA